MTTAKTIGPALNAFSLKGPPSVSNTEPPASGPRRVHHASIYRHQCCPEVVKIAMSELRLRIFVALLPSDLGIFIVRFGVAFRNSPVALLAFHLCPRLVDALYFAR